LVLDLSELCGKKLIKEDREILPRRREKKVQIRGILKGKKRSVIGRGFLEKGHGDLGASKGKKAGPRQFNRGITGGGERKDREKNFS